MDTDRLILDYRLTDDLARLCLPMANRDPNRRLAWTNSICILFLVIGLFGAKPAAISIQPVPQLEEAAPALVEPAPPPPQTIAPDSPHENQDQQEKTDAPRVVVVTPESPSINFSVPTIGTIVVPSAIAAAPPLRPLQPPVALQRPPALPASLQATGSGGERPQPPYPKLALERAEQGTVTLFMTADEAGKIISVELKASSGCPVLDRGTLDYVKRHWRLPAGIGTRTFETRITYRLQAG